MCRQSSLDERPKQQVNNTTVPYTVAPSAAMHSDTVQSIQNVTTVHTSVKIGNFNFKS